MDYDYVRMRRLTQEDALLSGNNSAPERYQRFSQEIYNTPANLPVDTRIRRNAPPAPTISALPPSTDRTYNLQPRYSNTGQSYDPAYPLDVQPAPPTLFKSNQYQAQAPSQSTRYSQSEQRLESNREERPPRFDPFGKNLRSGDIGSELELRHESRTVEHFSVDRASLETRYGSSNRNDMPVSTSFPSQEFTRRTASNSDISNLEGTRWRSDSGRIVPEETSWENPTRREIQRPESRSTLARSSYLLDNGDDELDRFLEAHLQKGPQASEFTRPARSTRDVYGDEDNGRDRDRFSESYYRGRSAAGDSLGDTYSRHGRALELSNQLTQAKEIDWQLPCTTTKSYSDPIENYRRIENTSSNIISPASRTAEASSMQPLGTVATFRRKVTHVDGQIGFAGTDLFFQMSKVVGPLSPQLGSWVIVKAEKVQSMPFDWNALSVEVEKQLAIDSDPRALQYQGVEQIPLLLPSQNTYSIDVGDKPLKSILKNKPPPPPQISGARPSMSHRPQPRPPSPRSGGGFRNRSPSPESPLILFENIIPEKRQKVSADRKSRKLSSEDRGRKRSKSPNKRSIRKSPRRSPRAGSPSPRRYSRSPRRLPIRSSWSRSPRRSPRRDSKSPRRSPRRLSRSPRRSPRRLSRSPRRSPARDSRSPRRAPRRDSRSPRRAPARDSRSPGRAPRRDSTSPRRAPRRDSTSPRRAPRRDSRSPDPLSRKESLVSKTKQTEIQSLLTLTVNPVPEPKKPVPVSFTWTKSAKDPSQPAATKKPPRKKRKKAQQLPAFKLVEAAVNNGKKQSSGAQAAPTFDTQQRNNTAQKIPTVNENSLQDKATRSNVKNTAPTLTSIPLLPIPNEPAYHPNPNYPPNFGQVLPQPSYYPGPSYPAIPGSYGSQPYAPQSFAPQSYAPQTYVSNQQYNYPDQYQQPTPFFGNHIHGPVQYQQPIVQTSTRGQNLHPPGLSNPSQILRTSMGPTNASKVISSNQPTKKKPYIEKPPVLLKNPFHKSAPQEPLPPGTEGGQTSSKTPTTDQTTSAKVTEISKPTIDPLPTGTSTNQLDDLSDDEICTIYVKPASALFEDASETEVTPEIVPSKNISQRSSKCSTPKNLQLNQEDLQAVSDEDNETEAITPATAIELGCHPDKAAEARKWMICVRCAQKGHLHDMCDKERVPRALPFEISMAKALLKESRQKYFENSKNSNAAQDPPTQSEAINKAPEKEIPGNKRTGGNYKTVVTENIPLWEEERQRLKQKANSEGNVAPVGSKTNVKETEVKGQTSKGTANTEKNTGVKGTEKKGQGSTEVHGKGSKSPVKPPPKQIPVVKAQVKPSNQKANLPAKSAKSLGPQQPKEPKNTFGGFKSSSTESSKKSGSMNKLSEKLTQRRKAMIESYEGLDKKQKKGGSSHRTRSSERHSSSYHILPDDSVVRINRRRSLSPREREQVFNDPMRAVAVKQLEIKSLELRDLELQQKMKLLLAEKQQMEMHRHPHPDPPRLYDDSHEHGGHPASRVNPFCYVCLGTGHRARDCQDSCPSWVRNKIRVPEGFVIEKSRGLLEPFCLSCGKVGHFTRECRYRNNFGEYSDDD